MKTTTLIFALCLVTLAAKSQEWAPVGAAWHYTEEIFMPIVIDEDYIKFESVKDTIYEGKLCRKITKRHYITCSDRPETEYMYSENGKVWFWDPAFNTFQVLYDFGAGPGQSWTILIADVSLSDTDTLIVTVDSTDTVLINGISLKRLFVTYDFRNELIVPFTYTGEIIESVGDLYYMFNFAYQWAFACDGNFSGGLRCYEDSVIGLYETGLADSCTYVHTLTGIGPDAAKDVVKIRPNPADEAVIVESETPEPLQYVIQDPAGRILQRGRTDDGRIITSGLQPGICVLTFTNAAGARVASLKLVIRR
jgi:hypothetical protein